VQEQYALPILCWSSWLFSVFLGYDNKALAPKACQSASLLLSGGSLDKIREVIHFVCHKEGEIRQVFSVIIASVMLDTRVIEFTSASYILV
jgi:hypothetical protein